MLRKIPAYIRFLIFHYGLGLFFFFIFRLILLIVSKDIGAIPDNEMPLLKEAFKIGFQFDSVIMGYILVIPLIILFISSFFKSGITSIKVVNYLILFLIFIAFFISSADIPYFNYNFSRISAVIFEWTSDTSIILSMIIEEPSYIVYSVVFLFIFSIYVYLSLQFFKRICKKSIPSPDLRTVFISILSFIIGLSFVFAAMRGRVDSPIRINHAFFCNNSFYNQLGLNPVFTLLKSAKQSSSIKLIDDKIAISNTQKYLKISEPSNQGFPLSRKIVSDSLEKSPNIVLVIMESMSANKLSQFGNQEKLTPFLDSLANVSLNFKNIYSAGRHTCNGIFASLYSYPAILRERPMSALNLNHYSSLPEVFQNKNYKNIYFTSHIKTFDNIGVFLPQNNIDRIFSLKDYDQSLINNSFGIPDHVLFDYAISEMDNLYNRDKKFFTTVMTISDHGPYVMPNHIPFIPHSTDIHTQMVEYADWSISQLMKKAKQKDWFNNTIFIFVADHGVVTQQSLYEIPLSLHHIPLLIYSPDSNLIQPKVINSFGNQIDVLPTLAGLLNIDYTNNTLGVDLLKDKRPFSYFSSDDKLGCINDKYYYIYRKNGSETLHLYRDGNPENVIDLYPELAKEMRNYVVSMTQASKWIIENKKTSIK